MRSMDDTLTRFDHTLDTSHSPLIDGNGGNNFTATVSLRSLGKQMPYQLTYGRLLKALAILGAPMINSYNLSELYEVHFEISVYDPEKDSRVYETIAKGSIVQPPIPFTASLETA